MRILILSFLSLLILACNEPNVPLPKPRIYPKVTYPEKEYVYYENNACPFKMKVPTYFKYKDDNKQINNEKGYNCWFNLHCSELNTYIHFSYIPVKNRTSLDELIEDAFEMADKHNVKASFRNEIKVNKESEKVYGLIFNIDGPVASPTQFFLTDSTDHFLRGSLYFNDVVNRDSIAPVYNFIKDDFAVLFDNFEWVY